MKKPEIKLEDLHFALVNNTTAPTITLPDFLFEIKTESTLADIFNIQTGIYKSGEVGLYDASSGIATNGVACDPSDGNADTINKISISTALVNFHKYICSDDILESILNSRMVSDGTFDISGSNIQDIFIEEWQKAIYQDVQKIAYIGDVSNSPLTNFDKTNGLYASLEAALSSTKLALPSPMFTKSNIEDYILTYLGYLSSEVKSAPDFTIYLAPRAYELFMASRNYSAMQNNSSTDASYLGYPVKQLKLSDTGADGNQIVLARKSDLIIYFYSGINPDFVTEYHAAKRQLEMDAKIRMDVVITHPNNIVYVR